MEPTNHLTFKLPEGEFNCQKPKHHKNKFEFVCTKRDCEDRLACAQCILDNHSDHFQWMVVIEEFFSQKFLASELNGESDDKYGMQHFVKDRVSLVEKFEKNVDTEDERVRSSFVKFKQNCLDKFEQLENKLAQKNNEYRESFENNIEIIQKFTSSNQDVKFPEVINDLQTLQDYLNAEISKENDLREKKFEKTFEELKDLLNALSLMEFEKKKTEETINMLDNILDFNPKTDTYEFYKKSNLTGHIELNYNELVCTRTIQTTHKKAVYKVLPLDKQSKIITCSDDHTIMIYDLKSGEPLNTLLGHTDRIWNIIMLRNGNIASCSSDNTIKIWNPHKGTCEKTLAGHTGPIRCLLEFPNLQLLSGSHDKTLKLWDLKSESTDAIKTIKHESMGRVATCIVVNVEDIAFGSEANIRVINFTSGAVKQILRGHKSIVRDLQLVDVEKCDTLLSASEDKTIMMWNLIDGSCLKTFNGHTRSVNRIMMFNSNTAVSAGDDSVIKFWSLETGECNKTLSGHEGWISYFSILANGNLISCGDDKTIKVWGVEQT